MGAGRLGGSICGALSILLILLHLGTLEVPSPSSPLYDEAALTDYARSGRLSSWEQILPKSHGHLVNLFAGGLWGGYIHAQRWAMDLFGAGVVQYKIGGAASALLGLFILAWMTRRTGMPWFCPIAMLLFGFSKPFFAMTHSVRPEGYVFLAMAINWFWFFGGSGRLLSFLAGLTATGSFVFHQAAVFLLLPMSVMIPLKHGRKAFVSPRCWWWAVGAAAGVVYAAHAMDIGQGVQYLQLTWGHAVEKPPLLRLWTEPFSILRHSMHYLYFSAMQGYAWHCLLSCMLFVLAQMAWRYRKLGSTHREMLDASLLIVLSFSLFSASRNPSYFIYLVPWIFLPFLAGVTLLLRGEMELGFLDRFLLAGAVLFPVLILLSRFAFLSYLSSCLCLLSCLEMRTRTRLRILIWGALAGSAIALLSGRLSLEPAYRAAYLLENRPLLFLLLVAAPWILLYRRRGGEGRSATERPRVVTILLSCCALSAVVLGVTQLQWEFGRIRENDRVEETEMKLLRELRDKRRVAAPAELGFYQPSIAPQAVEALRVSRTIIHFNAAQALIDYRPNSILWPADDHSLEEEFSRLRGGERELRWGAVWRMRSGDWRELRIVRRRKPGSPRAARPSSLRLAD